MKILSPVKEECAECIGWAETGQASATPYKEKRIRDDIASIYVNKSRLDAEASAAGQLDFGRKMKVFQASSSFITES